jgi:hypothetical protein
MNAALNAHTILLNGGKLDGTTEQDIRSIFGAIDSTEAPHVVIHFHGGLIDKKEGLAAAENLIPLYRDAGAYPIIFVWESGWREVIDRNVKAIFSEPLFQRILAHVTQFAKAKIDQKRDKDVPRSVTLELPKTSDILHELERPSPFLDVDPNLLLTDDALTRAESRQFKELLEEDDPFQAAAKRVLHQLQVQPESAEISAPGLYDARATLMTIDDSDGPTNTSAEKRALQKDVDRGLVSSSIIIIKCGKVLSTSLNRFMKRRHHGFYPTIVEELLREFYLGNCGKFLWDEMKNDIDKSFGFATDNGGYAIVGELARLSNRARAPHITVVGHSAGSIFACRLLRELHTAPLLAQAAKVNLILIAAAIDMKSFAETLRASGSRLAGFRSFGMSDQVERADAILGRLYPYSLLYFVSGVLETTPDTPLVGMQRYYGSAYEGEGFEYIRAVQEFDLVKKAHSFVWSPASHGPGLECDMQSHGGWVKASSTVQSIQHMVSSGYDYGA